MRKRLKVPTRKRTDPKPVCPLCNGSPTSQHWTDEWLHWHQVHWCQVLREEKAKHSEDTKERLTVPELPEDQIYESGDEGVVDFGHFSDPSVYRTRSVAAQLEAESLLAVEPSIEFVSNTTSSSSLICNPGDASPSDSNISENGLFPIHENDTNIVEETRIIDENPIDVTTLVSFMTQKNEEYSLNTKEHQASMLYRQPAFFAVQQFLSQHPQESQTATNDLLKLVKHLTSPQLLYYSTQLPVTQDALWREVYDNIKSSTTYYKDDDDATNLDYLSNRYQNDVSKVLGLHVREVKITETLSVQVPYFDIVAVILDLIINNVGIKEDGRSVLSFKHTASYFGAEHRNNVIYNDVTTALWWKELEEELPTTKSGAQRKIIAVLPYLDGVSVDFFDSISMIPWVISLGNLEREHRAKLSSKRLVAFIPNPSDEELRLQAGVCGDVSGLRKLILDKSLEIVLSPIIKLQSVGGLSFKLPGCPVSDVFYPAIPFFIGDNKELNKLAGVRTGHLTKRQCRFCTCLSSDMNNFHMGVEPNRTTSAIIEMIDSKHKKQLLKDISVAEDIDKSYLFKNISLFGILGRDTSFFESFPPDNLHSLYAGVVKYTVCWTLDLIKCYSKSSSLVELDSIFLQHFRSGSSVDAEFKFIVPKKGLSRIAILSVKSNKAQFQQSGDVRNGPLKKRKEVSGSAGHNKKHTSKFRSKAWGAILVALAFTLGCSPEDKLLPSDHSEYGRVRDIVMQALISIMHVFFELQRVEYTEKGLQTLEDITIPTSLTHLYQIYRIRQDIMKRSGEFHGIKLHLMLHIPHLIRRFGTPMNWDTNTYESSHKTFVKKQWESGAKRTEDLELNTLKSYKFWCEVCQRSGVTSNGRLVPSYHLSEKYVSVNIRRWRRNFSDDCDRPHLQDIDSFVSYKFTIRGHQLHFKLQEDIPSSLTVRSRFVLDDPDRKNTYDHDDNNENCFKPHNLVTTYLLELLLQFSRVQNGALLSSAFQSARSIALGNMKITLHEHILIKGEGIMEGYSDFRIYATNKYGTSKRVKKSRYDVVEVTIPRERGGNIAANDNLMRVNKDTAIARVLSIVTLQYYERELCLLFLQFMKKSFPEGRQGTFKRHVNRYLKDENNIFYGKGQRTWLALYPLITLKGPALHIKDPYHEEFGHVLPLKFICRGGWWPEATSDDENILQYIPPSSNQIQRETNNRRSGDIPEVDHEYSSSDEDELIESNSDESSDGSSDHEHS